ncbi:MAG: hypothetical protein E7311_04705 [Clostridiales bacterium]|nr:hypothetical protein [Clostridiales bacterium]
MKFNRKTFRTILIVIACIILIPLIFEIFGGMLRAYFYVTGIGMMIFVFSIGGLVGYTVGRIHAYFKNKKETETENKKEFE